MLRCSKCKKIKPLNEFFKRKGRKRGYQYQCKECIKEGHENNPEYRKKFNERHKKRRREWVKSNPEKHRENIKTRNEQRKNDPKFKKRYKIWKENNPKKLKVYRKKNHEKRCLIFKYRLSNTISSSIKQSLKRGKNGRHWEDIVDFNLQEFIKYFESLFKLGMSWENHGKWHIDHIRPISSFKFNSYNDKEFKKCWALKNLQPLWAFENLSKGNKIF